MEDARSIPALGPEISVPFRQIVSLRLCGATPQVFGHGAPRRLTLRLRHVLADGAALAVVRSEAAPSARAPLGGALITAANVLLQLRPTR